MAKRKKTQPRKWAPRATSKDAQGVVFACRLRPQTREALERAARGRGWTTSAEAERRLAASFAIPETQTQAFMAVVALAIDTLVRMRGVPPAEKRDSSATWLNDPYLHQQAVAAALTAFALVAPKGRPPTSEVDLEAAGGADQGKRTLGILWHELRTYRPKDDPAQLTRHDRQLVALREGLGHLLDRVEMWGRTGREAAKRATSLDEADLKQFRELSRKRSRQRLTKTEHQRFLDLHNKFPVHRIPTQNVNAYQHDLAGRGPVMWEQS